MRQHHLTTSVLLLTSLVLVATATHAGTRSLKEIREDGVVIQQWDSSCGAAALATVFSFTFNDPVTEREVAKGLLRQTEPLKVRHRGGFSMLDMKRYAAERGYQALGFQGMRFADIRYLDAPIVPVNFHGYHHYVVYKGLSSDGKIHLADPAFGNRFMTQESFEAAWVGGTALVMLRSR